MKIGSTLFWLILALVAMTLASCKFQLTVSVEGEQEVPTEVVVEEPAEETESAVERLQRLFPEATIVPVPPMDLPDIVIPTPKQLREILPPLPRQAPNQCFQCHKGDLT